MTTSVIARVAVVTGASRGLGLACARRLAAEGTAVVLVGRDADALDRAVDSLRSTGAVASFVIADVRDRSSCAVAVEHALAAHGRLDVVVNAAGVFPRRPLLDMTAEDWHHVLDTNVLGTYFMMIEAIARMSDGGRIINVASVDGVKAHPANAHYAASKAAVISITRSMALEVAPLGILVNAVSPGAIATETAIASDWYAPMVKGFPTGRPIEPEEVANVVAFLASPTNVSITGENVVVSGGSVIV